MDSQACFTSPIGLTNQNAAFSSFARSFPRLIQPSYDVHSYSPESKDEKELFLNHANTNMCYQTAAAIRRNSEFLNGGNNNGCGVGDSRSVSPANMNVPAGSRAPHDVNGTEATNLSVKNLPADATPGTNQTNGARLSLREILQNNKPEECDDMHSNADDHHDNASNADSFSENDSDDDVGNKVPDKYATNMVGTIMGNGGSISDNGSDVRMKKSRVESIVSSIRAPSNGTSSSENSETIGENRKTKRKQVYPQQQIDEDSEIISEKDLWRKQLLMMQQQINVMQERYDNLPGFRSGVKRRLDDMDGPGGNDFMIPVIERGLESVASNEEVRKLAVLISAEIQEQINPIISSVLAKYIRKPKENAPPPPAKSKPRTRTPTPAPVHETPARSPSIVTQAARAVKTERSKQPVNMSNDMVHAGKHFSPLYNMGFPPRPFFSNESKLGNDFFSMSHFAAAAMASAAPTMYNPHFPNFLRPGFYPEQTEAIPLVVSQKKKRHKVTDTRITPRVMSKVMNHKDDISMVDNRKFLAPSPSSVNGVHMSFTSSSHPLLARSLATQNSLNHSESSAFHPSGLEQTRSLLPAGGVSYYAHPGMDRREMVSPTDNSMDNGSNDMNDQNSMDGSDSETEMSGGRQPSVPYASRGDSLTFAHSVTLTPMHLRKAKLMFFYTRYPNSATLKTFFPDIKFNKNNTAQLVKWFSNFREFYYIQMEKYARQALAEGVKSADEIHVPKDSELYRVLNLHYNRNNHIEVPDAFRDVVEETLKEFFKAVQGNRDQEPSWKKSIYKIINRMDDVIPDYFKSAHFLEQLE